MISRRSLEGGTGGLFQVVSWYDEATETQRTVQIDSATYCATMEEVKSTNPLWTSCSLTDSNRFSTKQGSS
jgi:hypothetical protein